MTYAEIERLLDAYTAMSCEGKSADYLDYFRSGYYKGKIIWMLIHAINRDDDHANAFIYMMQSEIAEPDDKVESK